MFHNFNIDSNLKVAKQIYSVDCIEIIDGIVDYFHYNFETEETRNAQYKKLVADLENELKKTDRFPNEEESMITKDKELESSVRLMMGALDTKPEFHRYYHSDNDFTEYYLDYPKIDVHHIIIKKSESKIYN